MLWPCAIRCTAYQWGAVVPKDGVSRNKPEQALRAAPHAGTKSRGIPVCATGVLFVNIVLAILSSEVLSH